MSTDKWGHEELYMIEAKKLKEMMSMEKKKRLNAEESVRTLVKWNLQDDLEVEENLENLAKNMFEQDRRNNWGGLRGINKVMSHPLLTKESIVEKIELKEGLKRDEGLSGPIRLMAERARIDDEESIKFKEVMLRKVNELDCKVKMEENDGIYRFIGAMHSYNVEYYKKGEFIYPLGNRRAYKDLEAVSEKIIKITETDFLLPTSTGILAIDIKGDTTYEFPQKGVERENVLISADGDRVYLETKNGMKKIIDNNKLISEDSTGTIWRVKNRPSERGYPKIYITIDNRNMGIKVHHLHMLLKNGLAVLSTCIWSGASILEIDHINSDKTDNSIDNLQIITKSHNVRKRGDEEQHLKYSELYCYDYSKVLKLAAELVYVN